MQRATPPTLFNPKHVISDSAISGITGDVLNSALTRFMRRRGSTVKLPITKPITRTATKNDPNTAPVAPFAGEPSYGAAARPPPGMSRRLTSQKAATGHDGKHSMRRPSGKLRPPEFSRFLGSKLDRDMEVGILPLMSIIDAVIAVIDADVAGVGNTVDSDRSHDLNMLKRIRFNALGNMQPQDLVAAAPEPSSNSSASTNSALALTEEGAERIMRMIAKVLHHTAAGTMLLRELSGEDSIIDTLLDSL